MRTGPSARPWPLRREMPLLRAGGTCERLPAVTASISKRRSFVIPLAWIATLITIGALHIQLNRGGFRQVLESVGHRDRLQVGHLPVT